MKTCLQQVAMNYNFFFWKKDHELQWIPFAKKNNELQFLMVH